VRVRPAITLPDTTTDPDTVRFDLHDAATFAPALAGVDRVFLLRPPALASARADFGPFVAAMAAARVVHVVFLSVRGAGSNPLLPHARIEKLIEASGLPWTHLRPSDFMQNFATVHRADIRDSHELWSPGRGGRTSYVDVRDVAAVGARVLTSSGHDRRAYTLPGGGALDLDEVARVLSAVLGYTVVNRDPGALAVLRCSRAVARPLQVSIVMLGIGLVARLGLAAAVSGDIAHLLGRAPTTFTAFARDYAHT